MSAISRHVRLASGMLAGALFASGCGAGGVSAEGARSAVHVEPPNLIKPGPLFIAFANPTEDSVSPFARPWPSELARNADGTLDIRRFPGRDHPAVRAIFDEIAPQLSGFSTRPAIYFRFRVNDHDDSDVAVIKANDALKQLPKALAGALKNGAIRLWDVDPKSPERGRTVALTSRYLEGAGYVPSHVLALRPVEPLRPATLYAAVVKRRWSDKWPALGTNGALEQLKSRMPNTDERLESARSMHAPPLDLLASKGVPRKRIAAIALFRTQDVGEPVRAVVAEVDRLPAARAPKVVSLEAMPAYHQATYWSYRGYYCTPNFQTDLASAPFHKRGGAIVSGADGRPQVVDVPKSHARYAPECAGSLRARFTLAVPKTPVPADGFRLMMYAHGTTGNAFSAQGSTGFAVAAAKAGMATVSTDQPLHGGDDVKGARPGSLTPFELEFGNFPVPLPMKGQGGELAFFNFLRPPIMRDNIRQAVADGASLARAVLSADFAARFPVTVPSTQGSAPQVGALRFNRTFGYVAAGHSQGTRTALPLGAHDPMVRGVLSSAGGGDVVASALDREDSKAMMKVVQLVLGLGAADIDGYHPFSTLFQTVLDPVDLQNHGAALYRGDAPSSCSVLLINGRDDTMTVHRAAEALAVSLHATPLGKLAQPMPLLAQLGLVPREEVAANGNAGASTIALLHLSPSSGQNGHYVAFSRWSARQTMEQYLRQLASGKGAPRLSRKDQP